MCGVRTQNRKSPECRTDLTKQHCTRVSGYAGIIARGLGLDEPAVECIELATLLHDVGKIGFSDSLLDHANWISQEEFDLLQKHGIAPLQTPPQMSEQETATFKSHTLAGSRILAVGKSRILELAAIIAMSHHEKWDGSGYPLGLGGDNIPLEGRIVAVANAFDLLSTKQCHREAFSGMECYAILADNSGTHFDPKVLEALVLRSSEILQLKAGYAVTRRAKGSNVLAPPPADDTVC